MGVVGRASLGGLVGSYSLLKGGALVRQVSVRARVFGAALVVGVLLAGCNGGSGPEETETTTSAPTTSASTVTSSPSPSESVTPQPSETSVLPPLPDAAKENTAEGAEAFIRYYFEVANSLYMEPRSGLIPLLSDPDCVSCQRTEDTIVSLEESGSRARTEPFIITSLARVGGGTPELQRFNMVVEAPDNATVDSNGNESNPGSAATLTGVGAASWDGGQWVLYDLELAP